MHDVFTTYAFALRLLESEQNTAFKMFNRACGAAEPMFKEQPYHLVAAIARLFNFRNWRRFASIQKAVLQYLADMAAIILGKTHPVAVIMVLSLAQTGSDITFWSMLVSLSFEIADHHWSIGDTLLDYKLDVCMELMVLGEYVSAEKILDDVSKVSRSHTDSENRRIVRIKYLRGYFAYAQGRSEEAAKHLVDCLRLISGGIRYKVLRAGATHAPGILHWKRENWEESAYYLRLAFEDNLSQSGSDENLAVSCFFDLRKVLQEQGKMDEVQALEEQNQEFCQEWKISSLLDSQGCAM